MFTKSFGGCTGQAPHSNSEKCKFFTGTIDNLDHVIRPRRWALAPLITDANRGLQPPTKLTHRRTILGLCNAFRRFVPRFTSVTAPLDQRLKKDQPTFFALLDRGKFYAMETLKHKLIFPPILALSYSGGHMIPDTDACKVQIVYSLLSKKSDDKTKPVKYWFSFFADSEKRYDTIQRECLVNDCAVFLLQTYVEGHPFTICTVHGSQN